MTGAPPSVSIGASTPIAVYGNSIHVGGADFAGRGRGHRLRLRAAVRAAPRSSKIADIQTTTNGVWDFDHDSAGPHAYKATWKGKTSAIITVAVQPRLRLTRVGNWFVARAQPAKYGGHWLYVQRANAFGEWVSLKKVTLNGQSATRFKLRKLPHGLNRLRLFISTNQAGSGFFHGPARASASGAVRRRAVETPRAGSPRRLGFALLACDG